MTLKTILVSAACSFGILAVSPLAHAAGLEKKTTIIGAAPAASSQQTQGTQLAGKEAAPHDKSVSSPVAASQANACSLVSPTY